MRRTKDVRIERLRQVELFSALHERDLSKIGRLVHEASFPQGAVLARQGVVGAEAFIIVSGEVSVECAGRPLAQLGAGAVVGELALVDGQPRSATLVAASDVDVLVLGDPELQQLLTDVPTVGRRVLAQVARRLRAANATLSGA